jgi:general secretion pathway protein A
VLVTGEPGAGKTWLAERLLDALAHRWCALSVEVTGALDAIEFYRMIGHSLGLTMTDRLGEARLMVGAALQDARSDGRHWILLIDEAQRSAPSVWEELEVLASRVGGAQGFAALLLMGRTELARCLSTPALGGLAACLSLHVHLMALDLDETRELLRFHSRTWRSEEALQELHRDALGNPARLLRLADSRPWIFPSNFAKAERHRLSESRRSTRESVRPEPQSSGEPADFGPAPAGEKPREEFHTVRPPALIPTRPPIRLEDGLVEVGWEGDIEAEFAQRDVAPVRTESHAPSDAAINEELVEDRYAALQAWAEWTRNHERPADASGSPTDTSTHKANAGVPNSPGSESSTGHEAVTAPQAVAVRAEGSHEFAPYSQLFTRLRQSKEG